MFDIFLFPYLEFCSQFCFVKLIRELWTCVDQQTDGRTDGTVFLTFVGCVIIVIAVFSAV